MLSLTCPVAWSLEPFNSSNGLRQQFGEDPDHPPSLGIHSSPPEPQTRSTGQTRQGEVKTRVSSSWAGWLDQISISTSRSLHSSLTESMPEFPGAQDTAETNAC